MKVDLYEENRSLHAVLAKFTQYLEVHEPEILCPMENSGIFVKLAEVPDMQSGVLILASETSNATVHTGNIHSRKNKARVVKLNNDLLVDNW
jgi:hypothetical protein